ncbi:MAG: helix-hairpin-helix domain-containing protein [Desulfohalobiaceae bacterium]
MKTNTRRSSVVFVLALALVLFLTVPAFSAANTININEAPKEKLTQLYNIGPAKAKRIVEYRQDDSFDKKKEIKKVDGIGDKTYQEIKERIEI